MGKKRGGENPAEQKIITKVENVKNLHADHRKRMRERFNENRFDGWAKHEVLEFMLFHARPRINMNEIAHLLLLNSGKKLSRMFDLAQTEVFKQIDNIGDSTVDYLRHLKAFIEYYHSSILEEKSIRLTGANFMQVIEYMDFPLDTEDLLVICLNSNMMIKYVTSVAESAGENFATTRLDRIMKIASAVGAKNIVLVHNHPSGNPEPSYDDIYMTDQVDRMLAAVGIFLVDHFIISDGEVVSIKMTLQGSADEEDSDAE